MGLDFRIDHAPDVFVRKLTGDPTKDPAVPWESIPANEVPALMYDTLHGELTNPLELRFRPAPELVGDLPRQHPHWGYGGFKRFRERLWTEVRWPDWPKHLGMMRGFQPQPFEIYRLRTGYEVARGSITDFPEWEAEENEWWNANAVAFEDLSPQRPILALIHHSDCEGDLSPVQCALIAQDLRGYVASWGAEEEFEDYDREMAMALAGYMECAAANGRRLIFT